MGFLPGFISLPAKTYSPKTCAEVIGKAKESINIILPLANVDFPQNDAIISAIKKAVKKGVSVKVAYHSSLEMEKIGILGISGVKSFKIKEPQKRLLLSIDGKHALTQRTPIDTGHDVGIISCNANKLADEINVRFNELVQA